MQREVVQLKRETKQSESVLVLNRRSVEGLEQKMTVTTTLINELLAANAELSIRISAVETSLRGDKALGYFLGIKNTTSCVKDQLLC